MKTKTTKTAKTTYHPTYWASKGELQDIYEALVDALVPDMGAAPTEHGNALRWIGNIYYEIYNNGGINAWDSWYGKQEFSPRYAKGIKIIAGVANLTEQERATLRNALKFGNAMCDGNRPRSAKRLDDIVTKVTRAVLMAHLKGIPKPADNLTD